MKKLKLTDSKLLLLGLIAEMPRHAYELEQIIDQRGMREWTEIGFSSIYFVLGELEKLGLVKGQKAIGPKGKKIFDLTRKGQKELSSQTIIALSSLRTNNSSVLLGMVNWGVLKKDEAIEALETRVESINEELLRLNGVLYNNQPFPDYIEVLFEFSKGQLEAELKWVQETLDYMKNKPWI